MYVPPLLIESQGALFTTLGEGLGDFDLFGGETTSCLTSLSIRALIFLLIASYSAINSVFEDRMFLHQRNNSFDAMSVAVPWIVSSVGLFLVTYKKAVEFLQLAVALKFDRRVPVRSRGGKKLGNTAIITTATATAYLLPLFILLTLGTVVEAGNEWRILNGPRPSGKAWQASGIGFYSDRGCTTSITITSAGQGFHWGC